MKTKPRNFHAKHCPRKGGAHVDKKKESKRKPKRIPLWCSRTNYEDMT